MPRQVNVPGIGPVNFPDDMRDEDIVTAIETNILKTRPKLRDPQLVPEALGGEPATKTLYVQSVGGVPGLPPISVKVPRASNISPTPLSDAAKDYYVGAGKEIAEGAGAVVSPKPGMSRARGVSRVIRGVGKAAAPIALPYALGAGPVALAGGMVVGTLAQEGTERGLKALGVEEGNAELAGDVMGSVASVPALKATVRSARSMFKPKDLASALLDPDAENKAKVQDVVKWLHEGNPEEVSPAKQAAEVFGIVDKPGTSSAYESAKILATPEGPVKVPVTDVVAKGSKSAKDAAEVFGLIDKDNTAAESAKILAEGYPTPDAGPVPKGAAKDAAESAKVLAAVEPGKLEQLSEVFDSGYPTVDAGPVPKGNKSAQQSADILSKSFPKPTTAEKSASVFFPDAEIPSVPMNRDRRRALSEPPSTGVSENLARALADKEDAATRAASKKSWEKTKSALENISKSIFGSDYGDLPAEDAALIARMLDEGYAPDTPVEPQINLSDYQSFGGTGAITAMIVKLRQPKAKQLMNFDKLDISPGEKRLLQQNIARSAIKNKIDPFEVEPMSAVVDEAKKMGLPQAQNIVQHLKNMGIQNRQAITAMRFQINGLAKKVVDTEKLIASGTLNNAEMDAAKRTLAVAERDLRNMTDTFTGVSTETGRMLNAFKIEADNSWDVAYWLGKAKRMGGGYLDDTTNQKIRQIIVGAQNADGPGKERAKKELVTLVGDKFKRGITDTLSDLVRAGWLSSPKVHFANITANTLMSGSENAAKLISTVPDAIMAQLTNQRTVTPGSFTAAIGAVAKAKKNPARYQALTATAEKFESRLALGEGASANKADDIIRNWISGPVFKLLGHEDLAFKKLAFESSLNEQAKLVAMNEARAATAAGKNLGKDFITARAKELYSNPTAAMQTEAVAAAEFATFNNDNMVSQAVKAGEGGLRNYAKKKGQEGIANWLMFGAKTMHLPFVRTPTNVVARSMDYTLFAPIKFIANVGQTARKTVEYRFGSEKINGETLGQSVARALTPARQKAISESFGRGAIGAGLLATGYFMAQEGKGIPLGTKDPNELGLAKMRGGSPGSVLVDGKWRKLDAISPFGTIIGIGMDLYKQNEEKVGAVAAGKPDAFAKQLFSHVDPAHLLNSAGNVLDTSWNIALPNVMELPMLKGAKDVISMATGNSNSVNRYLSNKTAAFVPYSGLLGEISATVDPTLRETAGDNSVDAMGRGLRSRVPLFGREDLPPAIDRLGREIPTAPMDPLRSSPEKNDPLTMELNRIKVGGTTIPFKPIESLDHFEKRVVDMGAPPKEEDETEEEFVKRIEESGVKRGKFSRDEHYLIEHLAEYEIQRVLAEMIGTDEYKSAPDIAKKAEVKKIISEIRREINANVNSSEYQDMDKEQRLGELTRLLKERGLR